MNILKRLLILLSIVLIPSFGSAKQIELDFMVFETPNLPAEFWDDAIERTVRRESTLLICNLVLSI